MKWTKLSLVAALAASSAIAGGNISPVVASSTPSTTIGGKAVFYYYSDDGSTGSLLSNDDSSYAAALTLDVSHKFNDMFTANVTSVGFGNVFDGGFNFEGESAGAYFNVANITATYGDNKLVAGRQLLATPMITGFDWLLAPGAFEAYTLMNTSIDKVTLIASYVTGYRGNNSGTDFVNLVDRNYAVGAVYSDAFDASLWYYAIDEDSLINPYTQVYADASTEIDGFTISGQYVGTNYEGSATDSTSYGVKVATKVSGIDLEAAYVTTNDAPAGYIGVDGLYTSMWMQFAGNDVGSSYKLAASTDINGVSTSVAYADFDTAGKEFDLILGYSYTDAISFDAIFTDTDYSDTDTSVQDDKAFEFIATYKF